MGTGTPVHYEQTVRGGGCGECVRVHRYTMSKQSGKRNRRVCTGIPVQYEQTARGGGCGECVRVRRYSVSKQSGEDESASVYGYTGTLWSHRQAPPSPPGARTPCPATGTRSARRAMAPPPCTAAG